MGATTNNESTTTLSSPKNGQQRGQRAQYILLTKSYPMIPPLLTM